MGLEGTRLPTVRHWSITTRLTFLYGIYAFALLALASNIVYWSMLSNIQTVEWKFLTNKVFIFRTILAEHAADSGTLKQEVEWEKIPPHSGQYYAYYSRISDLSKKVILQTPGFDEALTNVVFPQPVRGDVDESSIERWKSVEGKSYLLISAWSKESKNRATDKTIDVALDVTQEDILVDQYERQMAVVLIIGLMLAVSLGYVVARRGMRPLTEIAQAAEH
ncbi:MAG TPA: hypothetical protein ENI62_10910, partial [Gammaproteobacteria bacterium]|nr:hypothetical protein [Gammaproteobacteria bacterium]